MNVFKMKINKKAALSRKECIYDYVSLYMGNEGFEEIGNNISEEEYLSIIGKWVLNDFRKAIYKEETIEGILAFEDDFGDFIECLYIDKKNGEKICTWAR